MEIMFVLKLMSLITKELWLMQFSKGSLIEKKLLDKRGAITVKGRNAVQ